MRLVATLFMTLDGVVQAPGGPDEDRSGGFTHGGWVAPYFDEESGRLVTNWIARADAFLLGRRTYDIFAGYWPKQPDANPIARAFNALPKHVASTTLTSPAWRGTSVVRDLARDVAALKAAAGRELQVHGSPTLLRSLIAHGLVDELRLLTFPVVLGEGQRIVESPTHASAFTLVESSTTSRGVIITTYRPDGKPRTGTVG